MNNPFEILEARITDLEKLLIDIKKSVNIPPAVESNKYLTRKDVADMLQIDPSSVYNWTKKGTLQAYQISGRKYYKLDEVEKAIVKLEN